MDRVGPAAAPLSRVGRDGTLALAVERRGRHSVVCACRSTPPLQVLAPLDLDGPAAVVSVLNPTGALAGGDRLSIDVAVGAGAHACLTTPSATKVYRTTGAPSEQDVRLRLGAEAVLEWVPDHTIPFAGADFRQHIDVAIGDGARLILVDAFAAGRIARQEAWAFARLESVLSVRDARGWLFHDRFVLSGGDGAAGLGRTDGRPYFATVALIGRVDAAALGREVAAALPPGVEATAGAGALPRGGAVARVLASDAPALVDVLDTLWAVARRVMLDAPPLALRKC